jgi:hypothetical protein
VRKVRNLAFAAMVVIGVWSLNSDVNAQFIGCSYQGCSSLSFDCDLECAPDSQNFAASTCFQADDNYGGVWDCYDCICNVAN